MPQKVIVLMAIPGIIIAQIFLPMIADLMTSLLIGGVGFYAGLTWKSGDKNG